MRAGHAGTAWGVVASLSSYTCRARGVGQERPLETAGKGLAKTQEFWVKFWGVRGSIACPGPSTVRYGGNTSCLEMRCGDRRLIFDAGTGLRVLDDELRTRVPVDADLFLTHTHFDHICGFPFFSTAFDPRNTYRMWAGHLHPERNLRDLLCALMSDPVFPVPVEIMKADMSFRDFVPGDVLEPHPGIRIRTALLNHPQRAVGYRVEFDGRAICYITDTEHPAEGVDPRIAELVAGADIMVYDAMFTDEEYPSRVGWGHSTWSAGMRLAEEAGVKTYVVFHHDPAHDDDQMDRIAAEVAERRPGTVVAREGMVLEP